MSRWDLLPRRKQEAKIAVKQDQEDPFMALQRHMDRMFDDFFTRGFGIQPSDEDWQAFSPHVDMVEDEKEIKLTAELPGMESKDVNVELTRNALVLSGEKRTEVEDKGKAYYRMERSYGSFRRSVALPCEVDAERVDAVFKNGVLTITLPKIIEAGECKRIEVKS